MDEEQPGPPLIHIMTSSDREFFNSAVLISHAPDR